MLFLLITNNIIKKLYKPINLHFKLAFNVVINERNVFKFEIIVGKVA